MKIIKPNAIELKQTDLFKHIEVCGRTCYKSEDKITDDSCNRFVNMLREHAHGAMLEHGTVYLTIPLPHSIENTLDPISGDCKRMKAINNLSSNKYTKAVCYGLNYYITTNYRVIVENGWEDIMQEFQSECTEYHPKRRTFKITCNRGVSHEFVRHRVFSFAQESQRYVSSCVKKSIKEYNCDSTDDIIAAYNAGFSMKNISLNSSFTEWDIRSILLKNDIKLRQKGSRSLRDDDYFNIIDTPEKAYLLGLIQTDGSVTLLKRGASLCITQNNDLNWYITDMLKTFSDNVTIVGKKSRCANICIQSRKLVEDLITKGIVPCKTQRQTDGDVDKLWQCIPLEYKRDFIRGLIDGDGSVRFFYQKNCKNESAQITFSSTQNHLLDLVQQYIADILNYSPSIKYKNTKNNVGYLSITGLQHVKILGEHLFANFKYPFGNPKKAAAWIQHLELKPPIADYKDAKFKVIEPSWIYNDIKSPYLTFNWIEAISKSEDTYANLRLSGLTPQLARGVLPNDTKTELIMTGFESDWEHFFTLRCAKDAHPEAKYLADMIKEQF